MTSIYDDALDDEQTTADALNISVATLRRWRRRKIGPKPTFIGRQVFYRRGSRRDWLRAQEGFRTDREAA
jgi:helix-turn-helix protein